MLKVPSSLDSRNFSKLSYSGILRHTNAEQNRTLIYLVGFYSSVFISNITLFPFEALNFMCKHNLIL